MAELGVRGRKWAVAVHVFSSAVWLGAAVAMVVVMALRPAAPRTAAELHSWCLAVKLIDDVVIIASAGAALLSGLFLCWRTKWGFFVWYWVSFKLIATVLMVTFGATCLGPWIDHAAAAAGEHGLDALSDPAYRAAIGRSELYGTLQAAVLAFVVFVSVFKPWGKIGRRKSSRRLSDESVPNRE